MNRKVFRTVVKCLAEGSVRMFRGKLFHNVGARIEKDLFPYKFVEYLFLSLFRLRRFNLGQSWYYIKYANDLVASR